MLYCSITVHIEMNLIDYDVLKLNYQEQVNEKHNLISTAIACFETFFLFWL